MSKPSVAEIRRICHQVVAVRTAMENLLVSVGRAGFTEFHYLDLVVKDGAVVRGRPMFVKDVAVSYDDVVVRDDTGYWVLRSPSARPGSG